MKINHLLPQEYERLTAEVFVSFDVTAVIAQANICACFSSESSLSVAPHLNVTYINQSNFKFCAIEQQILSN